MDLQVGELEGLVIHQDQDRLLRAKEHVQAGVGGSGLGQGVAPGSDCVIRAPDIARLLLHDYPAMP
jgi:hypothetical protein